MATYQTNHISLILCKKMEALCTTYNLFLWQNLCNYGVWIIKRTKRLQFRITYHLKCIKTENEHVCVCVRVYKRLEKHDRQWRNETLLTAEHTNLQPRTMWLSNMVKAPRASGCLDCSLRTWRVMVIKSVLWASAAWSIAKKKMASLFWISDLIDNLIYVSRGF